MGRRFSGGRLALCGALGAGLLSAWAVGGAGATGPAAAPPTTTVTTTAPAPPPPPPPPRADVICGYAGNDRIYASGNDVVAGGSGSDTFYTRNQRADVIFGGPGRDRARVDAQVDLRFSVEALL